MPRLRRRGTLVPALDGESPAAGEQPESGAQHRQALDDLFDASYRELRRLAACIRRADAKATISTATLVHETWIKLAKSEALTSESQLHLKRIVAKAMRQYVTEAARRRCAIKRGGQGEAIFVALDESLDLPVSRDKDLIALDEALDELERMNPRQALLVELRFYGGCDVTEAATVLGIAEATALRDWRASKAWLASQIRRGE
jgi:RNA polymerase sigma factor (TIGR02999 family)